MKECFKCHQAKQLSDFYRHNQMKDGRVNKCKDCNKVDVKSNYSKNIDYYREYDKNRQRYSLSRIRNHRYAQIKTVSERRGNLNRTPAGMLYLSKKDFDNWFDKNLPIFEILYVAWEKSGFTRGLAPSIDRLDNSRGYIADNMQWLTQSENARKFTH